MTPNEQDNAETTEERQTTELHPFASGNRGGPDQSLDDTMTDVPAMEPLPNARALPDPGYAAMPAPREYASGPADRPPVTGPADGPGAPSWPRPPVAWPADPRLPGARTSGALPARALPPGVQSSEARAWEVQSSAAGPRAPEHQPGEPLPDEPPWHQSPGAQQLWSDGPYAGPRVPDEAPPLRGHSVPWPEVRAAADYEATDEPLAAPPSLTEYGVSPDGAVAMPPEEPGLRTTSETLTSDMLLPGKRATPDGGWRRTVYRATGGLVRVGESSASMRRRDLVNRVRTPVSGGHQRVAVLSLKGGVGKTTVTVGLGATLASLRGDRVIAVDGNPDRGTLSDKVRLQTRATIRDLLNERAMVGRYADVRSFTSQMSSRLEILASDRDPGVSVAFSADDYRAVAGVLEHYYSICITDCGTGLLHSAMAGILELADQIVLVSSPSVDGARSASATLDWLDAHNYGDLVRAGVVALSAVRRKSKSTVDLDRLEQHFASRCRAVVRVPFDPHLEEGAEFELEYLGPETAEAYLTLAALVADGFARPGRPVSPAPPGFPLG